MSNRGKKKPSPSLCGEARGPSLRLSTFRLTGKSENVLPNRFRIERVVAPDFTLR